MEKLINKSFQKRKSFLFILSVLFLSSFQITSSSFNPLSYVEGTNDQTKEVNPNCLLITDKNIIYDLNDLSNLETNTINEVDSMKINYTLCKNVYNSNSVIGIQVIDGNEIVTSLAGSVDRKVNNSKLSVEKINETEIVTINLPEGDKCQKNNDKNYAFKIQLTCNKSVKFEKTDFEYDYECNFLLKANSQYACGFEADHKESGFFDIFAGIILCIAGNALGIFGYKFLNIGFIISCIIAFPIILLSIIFMFYESISDVVLYIMIGLGVVIGAIVSILLLRKQKYVKVSMAIIGAITGFLLGLFIYQNIITLIPTSYQKLLYYLVLIAFTVLGIFIGIAFARKVCIFGTSVIGGYIFMKGISFFLLGKIDYIDEMEVFKYAKEGKIKEIKELIPKYFYFYPILWIIFTIAYLFIQHKINPATDDCTDYKELEGKFSAVFGGIRIDTVNSDETNDSQKMMDDDY